MEGSDQSRWRFPRRSCAGLSLISQRIEVGREWGIHERTIAMPDGGLIDGFRVVGDMDTMGDIVALPCGDELVGDGWGFRVALEGLEKYGAEGHMVRLRS